MRWSAIEVIIKRQTDRQGVLRVSGNLAYTCSCRVGIRQEGEERICLLLCRLIEQEQDYISLVFHWSFNATVRTMTSQFMTQFCPLNRAQISFQMFARNGLL